MVTKSPLNTSDVRNDEVIAVVSDHWLRGRMATIGQRVLDVLNEGNTDFLRLEVAQVFSTADLKTPITVLDEVMIPKDKLGVVFIPAVDQAVNRPESELRHYHAKIQTRPTASFALICGHAIQGNIHLKGRLTDPIFTLNHALTRFFAMTQASVSLPAGGSMPASVAIANKQFIDCFYLGEDAHVQEQPESEPKASQPTLQISVMDDPLIRGLIGAAAGHAGTTQQERIERPFEPMGFE